MEYNTKKIAIRQKILLTYHARMMKGRPVGAIATRDGERRFTRHGERLRLTSNGEIAIHETRFLIQINNT